MLQIKAGGKTVSVSHYLNKSVKPKHIPGRGYDMYPVYTQVLYDSLNTKFKTFEYQHNISLGEPIYLSKKSEEYVSSVDFLKDNSFVKAADEVILEVVKFEVEEFNKDKPLKGLANRLKVYYSSVSWLLFSAGATGIEEVLKDILTYNQYIRYAQQMEPWERFHFIMYGPGSMFTDHYNAEFIKVGNASLRAKLVFSVIDLLDKLAPSSRLFSVYDWSVSGKLKDRFLEDASLMARKNTVFKDEAEVKLVVQAIDSLCKSAIRGVTETVSKSVSAKE